MSPSRRKPLNNAVPVPKQWERICQDLQREIISGKYRPRERLTEDEIMGRTGATRHAVRRAFDELARLGLTVRNPNRGIQVRDYTIEEIEELYEIRECLECRAVERFQLPAGAALLETLSDLADQYQKAALEERFADLFALNNLFHETFYESAGSQLLAQAIRNYTFLTHPIRTRAFPNKTLRDLAILDHWTIIDAARAGDRQLLESTIRVHLRRPKDYYVNEFFISDRF